MRYLKFSPLLFTVLFFAGCMSMNCKPPSSVVLDGTDSAVVGIYIDKNGYPQANVDQVNVHPGQRVVFVGPAQFDVVFKDQRSPIGKPEASSVNGVLIVDIPRNIFDDQRTAQAAVRELIYRYGIRYKGKLTDPTIRITPTI